jgi:DNA ligase (NAD+)
VDGFGSETIKKLYANGLRSIPDVYGLDKSKLVQMGFGPKVSENLIQQLERSRTEPLEDWRFLAAFGVYRMGLGMCERLLQRFRLEDVFNLTEEQLKTVHGFAKMTPKPVLQGLQRIHDRFWNLYQMGFNIQRTPFITEGLESLNSPIAGKKIVFTGAMKSGSREEMTRQAKALGARTASSVTGKTDLVIVGVSVGPAKVNEAKAKGVRIITEDEYLALIAGRSSTEGDSGSTQQQLGLFDQDIPTGK